MRVARFWTAYLVLLMVGTAEVNAVASRVEATAALVSSNTTNTTKADPTAPHTQHKPQEDPRWKAMLTDNGIQATILVSLLLAVYAGDDLRENVEAHKQKATSEITSGMDVRFELLHLLALSGLIVSLLMYAKVRYETTDKDLYNDRFGTPETVGLDGGREVPAVVEPFATYSNLCTALVGFALTLAPTKVDGIPKVRPYDANVMQFWLGMLGLGSAAYHAYGSDQLEQHLGADPLETLLGRFAHRLDNIGMIGAVTVIGVALVHGYVRQAQSPTGLLKRHSKLALFVYLPVLVAAGLMLNFSDIYYTDDIMSHYGVMAFVLGGVLLPLRKLVQLRGLAAISYLLLSVYALFLLITGLVLNQGAGKLYKVLGKLGVPKVLGKLGVPKVASNDDNSNATRVPSEFWPSGPLPQTASETLAGRANIDDGGTREVWLPAEANQSDPLKGMVGPGGDFFKWLAWENLGTKGERVRNRRLHDLQHGLWHYLSALCLGDLALMAVQAQDNGAEMDGINVLTIVIVMISTAGFLVVAAMPPTKTFDVGGKKVGTEDLLVAVIVASVAVQLPYLLMAMGSYLNHDSGRHVETTRYMFHTLTIPDRLLVWLLFMVMLGPIGGSPGRVGLDPLLKPCKAGNSSYDGCGLDLRLKQLIKSIRDHNATAAA